MRVLERLSVTHVGLALAVVLAIAGTGFLVRPAPDESFAPVPFHRTLQTGLTGVDVQQADANGWTIPRGEVFYSQYQYVVGYYGMAPLVEGVRGRDASAYGRPLAVFVSDYSGTDPRLTAEGYLALGNPHAQGWVRASEASFVVGSRARTPGGRAVVPFGDRADAAAFARERGGRVVDWETLGSALAGTAHPRGAALRRRVGEQRTWANETVDRDRKLLDRPVSVVVGEDAPTLAAAVARAPPNTTVRIPAGTYETNLTVSKPITLAGVGNATVLDGGGTGSVLTVRSPRVGVTNLHVAGVGDRNVGRFSGGSNGSWDRRIRLIYGRGDAAIRLADARGSIVDGVAIDTRANGVVLLNSSDAVVSNATVDGTETTQAGFMGVLPMYSRVVVQDSTIRGGRDGVYTHYADDLVVRRNEMRDVRYGVHLMYTSGTLIADNAVRNADAGVIVMTRPAGNLVVGNDVRRSTRGLALVGSASLAAGNVLTGNHVGLSFGTDRSVITHNVVVHNDVGVRDDTLVPTNEVFENDVVANGRPVDPGPGARDVWAEDGRGNYWGAVPGRDRNGDGVVDRPYRPTDAVDRAAGRSAGAAALARSPAVSALRAFQRTVPGLRRGGTVDPSPLARPVRPGVLDRLGVEASGEASA